MSVDEIKKALEGVTPGPWEVYSEKVADKAAAIAESAYQVEHTEPFAGKIFMLNGGGKCPALTGCGPYSEANARYIAAVNPAVITELIYTVERLQRENEELRHRQLAWRSMDSAPKDGKHCILSIPSGGFVYTVQGAFMGGKWINALNVDAEPLAWMPNVLLPDAYCPWKRPFSVPLASTGGEHHGN
ncbi:MAG: hypothetical protein DI595_12735 [Agrobacterium fabrum]|uniref:Uncharacterized protein n=1 Tax=Agrobacterium fabrum TaxID=1176649 RepID=A0A2W5F7P4_9HYPH|nr:MAG: hypothetical protein DI595_12735 [Agrobacterium fabrum]